jgi:hypothetical protein
LDSEHRTDDQREAPNDEALPDGAVLAQVTGPDTALVVGRPSEVSRVGSLVNEVPRQVLDAMTIGNAAIQGLIAAGEMSGQLVRLSAQSVAALQAYGPMADASGAFLGVVRDQQGQFAEVLRFTPIDGLHALALVGPSLSALALRMQLQQISRQLVEIERVTRRIEQNQDDELTAGVDGDLRTLREAYELLNRTGVISDVQWSKIAALTGSVSKQAGQTTLRFEHLIDDLAQVRRNGSTERSCHDRLGQLQRVEQRNPLQVIDLYVKAQQSAVLFEYLNVHRLITTYDPHLIDGRDASERHVTEVLAGMAALFDRFEKARTDAGEGDLSSWLPVRNWVNNKSAELELKLLRLKDKTDDVRSAVLAVSGNTAGKEHLALAKASAVS